ncbi:hypothetical protein ACOME3_009842 [Neoechinorhynchus agilis]
MLFFRVYRCTEQHEKPQQSTIQSMTTALLSPLVSFPMVSMRSGITEDDISDDLRKYRFNIQFTNLSDIHDLSFKRSGTLIKPVVNQTYHCSYLIFITISREHSAESISLCPPTRIKNVTRVRLKLYCHRRDDFPDYLPFDFPESCFPNVFTLASLEPDEVFEVPVQVVYHCEMLLAPDDPRFEPVKVCNSFFELNPVDGKSYIFRSPGKQSHIDVMRFWPRGITATTGVTSLVPSMIESKFLSSSVTNMGFYFKIDTLEHETVSASVAQYRFPPRMIIVTPALTITNALPFDVKIGELWVKTGRTLNYHSNDTLNQVSAQFEYDNVTYDSNLSYDGYSYTLSVKFVSATKEDYPIYLNICQGKRKESALPQANALVISAPYWIHNRTGLDLEFKAHDYRGIIELPASVRQRIFGYPFNRKGRAKIRLMHCARWSQEFNIETIGVSLAVPVKDKNNRTFEISCKITFSNTGLTRIIQFLPTYTLVNRSGLNVQLKDPLPQMSEVIVRPNGSHPFWPNVNPIMSLRTHDDNQGSMPWTSFPLVHCMSTAIGLGSQGATVSVGVPPGTKVTLKKLSYGDAPVQLRNLCSDLSISISQSIVTESSDLLLRPFESIYYIFPNSALTRNLYWSPVSDENSQLQTLFGKPAKFLAVFDRDDAGQCPVLKPNNERTNIFWMSSYDDVQRVLTFTDNGTLYQILGQPDFATFDLSITLNALKVSLINDTYEFGLLSCQGSEARWHMKTKSDGGVVMKIPSSKASADWLEYKYRQTIIDDGSNNEERCNQYVFDFMDMSVKEPSEGILIRTNRPAIELSYRQSAVCIAARVVIWHSQLKDATECLKI